MAFSEVSIGNGFGCAIDLYGNAVSWGNNENGELCQGDFCSRKLPSMIESLLGSMLKSLACGNNFVMALGRDVSQEE